MRGLFEKDFRLLCQNRQTLVLFLMMAGFLGLTQNGTFVLGYLSFTFSILLTSTISYDEMDQGFEFLMTLPVTPKTYVKEKYGFCTVGVIFSVVLSGIIYLIAKGIHGEQILLGEELLTVLIFVPIVWCVIAIMVPIQLKFGAEKGRIAIFMVYGGGAFLLYFVLKWIGEENVKLMTNFLNQWKPEALVLGGFLLSGLVLVISYGISRRIMEQKEY
ncbi:ABC-2 transporter permease [Dorea sp. OM02-2LB]|nr:ABC-2 transporter permease [Dorea sp. OM02-2LB]RGV95716.1 ABC-2 transporter permease [Ruminococcus sp. AF14-10]